jgi:hypothetical protein
MVEIGPISLTRPAEVTKDMVLGAAGTTAGILASDYVASSLTSAAKLAGDTALAVGVGTKIGVGLLSLWGATKTSGAAKTGLYLVGMGSFASMGLDVIKRFFPQATARLAARLGAPVTVVAAPYVTPAPAPAPAAAVAAGAPISVETPSNMAAVAVS